MLNKKMKQTNETGRSMVEMLGVLAVIGVLSVMGIAGYTQAMKSHKANEITNAVSKLYMMGISQNAGKGDKNLAYADIFGALSTLPNVSALSYNGTDKNISVTITDEDICNKVKNMLGETRADGECSGNSSTLTVTMNPSVSGEQGGGTGSIDTGTCANGNVWLSYAEEGHECDTTTPQNMGCTKNSDCDSGEYCKLENTDYECDAPNKGTCTTLDAGRETTYTDPNDTTKTKTFLVGPQVSWWAAENWCKAHHKSLVSYSTVNSLFDCEKDNESCTWNKFTTDSYWSNGTLSDYYWTAESYDSCDAWIVSVDDVYFGSTGRLL